jgi:transposase
VRLRELPQSRSRRAGSQCAMFSQSVVDCLLRAFSKVMSSENREKGPLPSRGVETQTYAAVRFLTGPQDARRAAPRAVQVADRWHLLRNLSEALRRALEPHSPFLRQAAAEIQKVARTGVSTAADLPSAITHEASAREQNRTRRYSLYKQMKPLADAGVTHAEIAPQLEVSLRTVQRWTAAGSFPERTERSYSHSVDPHARYLEQRPQQGCSNVSQLWRELRLQGYRGQLGSVWNWLRQHH